MGASTVRASSVADAVVSELTSRASNASSDADAFAEVEASVTGVAESIGQTAETVRRATLADSVLSVRVAA